MDEYKAQGFDSRRDYLNSLCDEYPRDVVMALASMLGPNEDFDGLVTALEDYAEQYDFE